jgi:hypothetical protein
MTHGSYRCLNSVDKLHQSDGFDRRTAWSPKSTRSQAVAHDHAHAGKDMLLHTSSGKGQL